MTVSSSRCHAINADKAFELLREHSQHNGLKLADVAAAIVQSYQLLMPAIAPPPTERRD